MEIIEMRARARKLGLGPGPDPTNGAGPPSFWARACISMMFIFCSHLCAHYVDIVRICFRFQHNLPNARLIMYTV